MTARLNYITASRDAAKAMFDLQAHVTNSGLEPALVDLVYLLVSRINGCAYCIDMHSKDLRALGESQLRIDLVHEWEEAPCYSDRERAAFAWAESVTQVSQTRVPDDVFVLARRKFTEEELVKLTLAVVTINAWNRLPFHSESSRECISPGTRRQRKARQRRRRSVGA